VPAPRSDPLDTLRADLERAIAPAGGRVGVGVALLGTDEAVVLGASQRHPMQSVFKLPLALTVLHAVDQRMLRLDQDIHVGPADYVSDRQHSPIRDQHPAGVTLPLADLLRAAASSSDGSAADVLLRLVGGPAAVTAFLRGIGVEEMTVAVTEKEMGQDPQAQYANWATPAGAVALLRALDDGRGLSEESRSHLLRLLTATPTGPNRIRGGLPAGTPVAHKTGSSRTVDGVTAATNDIGIITLPDGRRMAVAVFVSDSPADDATRERVIADVASAAYVHWAEVAGGE
jgi:beta-lactamase class A